MSIRPALLIAAPLLLGLSACGDDGEPTVEDDGREASGEVLEGTISDEMLPLDQVRSQPPLLEEVEETNSDETAAGTDESEETDTDDTAAGTDEGE